MFFPCVLGVWWIWECGEKEAFNDSGVARHRILWFFAGVTNNRWSGWETSRLTTFIFMFCMWSNKLWIEKYSTTSLKFSSFSTCSLKKGMAVLWDFLHSLMHNDFLSPLRCSIYHHLVINATTAKLLIRQSILHYLVIGINTLPVIYIFSAAHWVPLLVEA